MSRPSGVLELCQRDIKKQGFARSHLIARELSMSVAGVEALLAAHVENGALVTCALEIGEDRVKATEYRASCVAGGRVVDVFYTPGGNREPDPVKARLKEWRAPRAPSAPEPLAGTERPERRGTDEQHRRNDHAAPTAAPAAEPKGERPMSTKEKIAAAFKAHGPMLFRALAKRVDASEASLSTSLSEGLRAKPQLFAKLGGTPRRTIWGLPDQEAPKPDALETGAELGRRDRAPKHLHAGKGKKGAEGGSAAMRRKQARKGRVKRASAIPVASAAARKAWQTRRAVRVALTAEGSMLILRAGKTREISRDQVRAIRDVRRLVDAAELAAVTSFIERLDKAEVAA